MKRQIVATAYIPSIIHTDFIDKLGKHLRKIKLYYPRVISLAFDSKRENTRDYLDRLYRRIACELRMLDCKEGRTRHNLMENINFILLYLGGDESRASATFEKFGLEAFVTSIAPTADTRYSTPNDQRTAANTLVKDSIQALRHARTLFGAIAEQIKDKDNKTPLLLPVKNFGGGIGRILEGMREAMLDRNENDKQFRSRIAGISRRIHTSRHDNRDCFTGRSGLAFKGQRKAGARHGLPPVWADCGHELSCIIRGRLRFGVPYQPGFHYDCDVSSITKREFPSCHGTVRVKANRQHLNIAPNDNIR